MMAENRALWSFRWYLPVSVWIFENVSIMYAYDYFVIYKTTSSVTLCFDWLCSRVISKIFLQELYSENDRSTYHFPVRINHFPVRITDLKLVMRWKINSLSNFFVFPFGIFKSFQEIYFDAHRTIQSTILTTVYFSVQASLKSSLMKEMKNIENRA